MQINEFIEGIKIKANTKHKTVQSSAHHCHDDKKVWFDNTFFFFFISEAAHFKHMVLFLTKKAIIIINSFVFTNEVKTLTLFTTCLQPQTQH